MRNRTMTNERRCWENLANAIILQAVEDWYNGTSENRNAINAFFRSAWFSMLTDTDPEYLILSLYKQAMKEHRL